MHERACAVLEQLQHHVKAIQSKTPSTSLAISLPVQPRFDKADRDLVGVWKVYLRWEESNPLGLPEEERPTLVSRVTSAYRRALTSMRFFPELWYMAYVWTASTSTQELAIKILEEGIVANPTSFVLHFAYAEALEIGGPDGYPLVHQLYVTFLGRLRENLVQRERLIVMDCPSRGPADAGRAQGHTPSSFDAHALDQRSPVRKDLNECRVEYGVAWIMYMRFARRTQGSKAGLDVFGRALLDKFTPWQVYESAALTEYHLSQDASSATRIFQKGMEIFCDEVEFVLSYLSFLLSINDERSESK